MFHPNACLSRALKRAMILIAATLPLVASTRANDAALDLTFATHETPMPGNDVSGVRVLLVQPDGKIVVGGDFDDNFFANKISGQQQNLTRLNPDGHYDPGFKFSNVSSLIECVALLPDGKLLIGGFFDSVGRADLISRSGIARLNADGSTDAGFGPAGTYALPGSRIDIKAIVVQADGKILIGGAFRATLSDGTTRDNVMRLNADGTADPGFTPDPNALISRVGAVAVQPDGAVLVGSNGGRLLVRLSPGGALDPGFNAPGINGANLGNPYQTVSALVVQPDGKIVAGGDFVAGGVNVPSRASLMRFNTDGSLDLSFDANFSAYSNVLALALQADGKILVGGALTDSAGTAINGVLRVNADGGADAGFDSGAGALNDGKRPAIIQALAIQADGKALIGGNFVTYGGQPRAGVARLGGDGSTLPPTGQKLADLSGTLAGVQSKLKAGGTKTLLKGTLTVRNDGAKSAKDVVVAAYLSDDQSFSATDDRPIGTVRLADAGFSTLGKKGKQSVLPVKFKVRLSETGSTSGKYLLLVIDPDNTVKESNETNNVVVSGPLP